MVTEAQTVPPTPGPGIPPAVLEDIPTTDKHASRERKSVNLSAPQDSAAKQPAAEEPLEVTEKDIPGGNIDDDTPSGGGDAPNLDSKLDATFDSVTMEEIVSRVGRISKYYKVREMPRRLARVDMMFDSKGISSFFPSLSEAQNKALEANNYIATRIDDILSKVRGSMASNRYEC